MKNQFIDLFAVKMKISLSGAAASVYVVLCFCFFFFSKSISELIIRHVYYGFAPSSKISL